MQHAAPVRGGETAREPDADLQQARRRHRLRQLGERPAAHELGDQIRPPAHLADAVDGDDVGVREPRDRARLDEELLARAGRASAPAMNFTATGRSSSVSCARKTCPMAPGPSGRRSRNSSISDGGDHSSVGVVTGRRVARGEMPYCLSFMTKVRSGMPMSSAARRCTPPAGGERLDHARALELAQLVGDAAGTRASSPAARATAPSLSAAPLSAAVDYSTAARRPADATAR